MPMVSGYDADGNPIEWWEDDPSDGSSDPNGPGSIPGYSFNWNNNTATDASGQTTSLTGGTGSTAAPSTGGSSGGGIGNWFKNLFGLGGNSGGSGSSIPLLSALAGGAGALVDRQSAKKAIEQQERQSLRSTALSESGMDPFRQQLSQAQAAKKLDLLANAKYAPRTMAVPSEMQRYVPQMSGGFSYTPDPATLSGYEQLLTSVLSGKTAPTMTNPANYGKTETLNLLTAAAGNPATGRPARGAAGVLTGDPAVGYPGDERGEELLPSSLGLDRRADRLAGRRAQRAAEEAQRMKRAGVAPF